MSRAGKSYSYRRLIATTAVLRALVVGLAPASGRAQAPTSLGSRVERARAACDSASTAQSYGVMRRDSGAVHGNIYELRMQASKDSADARRRAGGEVTCRYDFMRGTVRISQPDERAPSVVKAAKLTRAQLEAEQECKHSINSRPGYEVRRVGTPVADGAHAWVMSLTVRRDGEEDLRATCRYDASSGRVALRPR
jgi:hypothetical protein